MYFSEVSYWVTNIKELCYLQKSLNPCIIADITITEKDGSCKDILLVYGICVVHVVGSCKKAI